MHQSISVFTERIENNKQYIEIFTYRMQVFFACLFIVDHAFRLNLIKNPQLQKNSILSEDNNKRRSSISLYYFVFDPYFLNKSQK